MTRGARIALLLALGAGCTVTAEQVGSPALLEDMLLPVGVTRADSIVQRIGVPDEIHDTEQGFRFVYHFERRNERRFLIGTYGLKLVTTARDLHREGSLELWFDAAGRVLATKLSDHVQTSAERENE